MDGSISRSDRPHARLPGIDGLRGVAALGVCLFHWEHIAFGTANGDQVFRFGLLGVELFFMISGFAILIALDGTRSAGDFIASRVIRLYPAYVLSVALTAVYVLWTGKYGIGDVIVNLTMLQSFFGTPNITNPYWTLAFEIAFYGFATAVLICRWEDRLEVAISAWLGVALAYRLLVPGAMDFDPSRPWGQVLYIVVMPQFAPFFALGMLVFRQWSGRMRRLGWFAGALALGMSTLGRGDFAQVGGPAYAAAAACCLAALALAARVRAVSPPVRSAAWLGRISYPLYLVHCTVANLCVSVGAAVGIGPAPAVLGSTVLSLALAASLHRRIEKPAARAWRGAKGSGAIRGATDRLATEPSL